MSNIRDVAKLANVSTATVSRVINHDTEGRMTEETKEKVWEAIAELNYKAPVKNIHKKGHSHTGISDKESVTRIGCVISTDKDKYSDPYFLSILSSIEDSARKNNTIIPFIVSSKELESSSSIERYFSQPLDGIILMYTLSEDIFSYIQKNVPAIVGIDTDHKSIDNIRYDHYLAASMAVDSLYEKGYRRIGFVGSAPHTGKLEDSKRFRGFLSAMYSHGLEFNKETVINCHWSEEECHEFIQSLYKKKKLPEAFVVSSDLMAMAILRALYDLNVRVPGEVAVMGISNIEMSKYSNPPLSTISIPTPELGTLAFDTLKQRIDGYDMMPRGISLPLSVVLRSST